MSTSKSSAVGCDCLGILLPAVQRLEENHQQDSQIYASEVLSDRLF